MRSVRLAVPTAALALTLALTAAAAGDRHAAPGDAAVIWGVHQVGLHERGTTNCQPSIDGWTRAMGLRVPPCRPWCGTFVHEAFRRAGVNLPGLMIDPERFMDYARAGHRGLRMVRETHIRRGDIVLMDFRPDKRASHMAIAVHDHRSGAPTVETVDGNSGQAIRRKHRALALIVAAVRVPAP